MIRHLAILATVLTLVACEKKRTPERHLISSDYEGVVITIFDPPGFPPLPAKDGFRIHEYPADGIIITSSSQEFGWASDEMLDVLEGGTHRPSPFSAHLEPV